MSKKKGQARFVTESIKDIKISKEVSIPKRLKSIVAKAKSKSDIPAYLQDLRKQNKISSDDIAFLIGTGVFNNADE